MYQYTDFDRQFVHNRAAQYRDQLERHLAGTLSDDTPTLHKGMGGQGVLAIPLPYNGWVQNLPQNWKDLLTPAQRQPIP